MKINKVIYLSIVFCVANFIAMEPEGPRVHFPPEAPKWGIGQKDKHGMLRLVTRKGASRQKIVGIIVAPKSDGLSEYFYDEGFGNYKALQSLLEKLAPSIIRTPSLYNLKAKISPQTISLENLTLELITVDCSNPSDLKNLVADIYSKAEWVQIVAFGWGESCNIINQASHLIPVERAIHTLIYFQSPIYEWYWSMYQKYAEDEKYKPVNFTKLYNLYTKATAPARNVVSYPDRKYRQQPVLLQNKVVMPVKNCLLFKYDSVGLLKDMAFNELYEIPFLTILPELLKQIDQFTLNFDLAAVVLNENPKRNAHVPIVFVNRWVELQNDLLWIKYGDKTGQAYQLLPTSYGLIVPNLPGIDLFGMISKEFREDLRNNDKSLKKLNIEQTDSARTLYQEWQERQYNAQNSQLNKNV